MNVVSFFDGARMGYHSLEKAGRFVSGYVASEIDENAMAIANDNYPMCENVGDVTKWREWDVDWSSVDLLIGGSPCQGFSVCGKMLEFDDPRSALIKHYFDALEHIKSLNPSVKFLLENVKMSDECSDEISKRLGVEAMIINSKLVSPQLRNRYYWFNWDCEQPKDRGISLQSIVVDGFVGKPKSWCMLESWNRFPKKTESVKKRYARSMMPIVFASESLDFDGGWRPLNIVECEILQGVKLGYTNAIDPKKAMGVLGNGWQCDTLAHIFKAMP
jgi:DNA (cytosine-5)-methyltransferase 3A